LLSSEKVIKHYLFKNIIIMQSQAKRQIAAMLMMFVLSSLTINCQELFTGRITYEMSYPGSRIDLATLEQLPQEVNIVAKNKMVRTEMEAGELTQIKIADSKNLTVSTILEILREKYVIHKSPEDIKQELREISEPKINFTNETKEILGYNCKKAEAIVYDDFGEEHVIEIYYTEEISGKPFNFNLPYKEIPGLMLVYEIRSGNLNMRYEATSIRSRWGIFISNRNFRIPSDAKEITFKELREKLQ